jgi:para-nitrobenzyl esterase
MQPGKGWSTLAGPRSEDCLYLNVFTPETYEPQSMPVLVFIHGGDYLQGGTADSELHGCNLVRATSNAVVVTIQYRLGVFGFLGDYRLAAREGGSAATTSTGNYGLLDQIAALRWVKNNVGVFGGNSGKIMIFGESAGAGSVNNLLVSPLARGLFHRAVMQSGAFALWTTKRMSDAVDVFDDLLDKSGCADSDNDDAIGCLVGMPAEALVKTAETLTSYPDQWDACRWAPTVDGVALTMRPSDIISSAPASIDLIADVPIMYGNNDEEGSSFLSETRLSSSAGIDPLTFSKGDLKAWIEINFDQAAAVEKAYPVGEEETNPTPWFAAQRIVGDLMLFCPGRRAAAALSAARADGRRKHSVFEYMFDRAPQETKWGAFHGAEVPYVFGNVPRGDGNDAAQLEDWELGQSMAWMWSMFAQYGMPMRGINATYATRVPPVPVAELDSVVPPWPAFVEFDTRTGGGLSVKKGLRKDVCDTLWNVRSVNGGMRDPSRNGDGFSAAVVIGVIFSVVGLVCAVFLGRRHWKGVSSSNSDVAAFRVLSEAGEEASDAETSGVDMAEIDLSDLN